MSTHKAKLSSEGSEPRTASGERPRVTVDRESSPDSEQSGFSGNLHNAALADWIQLVQMGRRDAVIGIRTHDGRKGLLWCREGDVIDAWCDGLFGEDAVYAALDWESGNVSVAFIEFERPRRIHVATAALLLRAAYRRDSGVRQIAPPSSTPSNPPPERTSETSRVSAALSEPVPTPVVDAPASSRESVEVLASASEPPPAPAPSPAPAPALPEEASTARRRRRERRARVIAAGAVAALIALGLLALVVSGGRSTPVAAPATPAELAVRVDVKPSLAERATKAPAKAAETDPTLELVEPEPRVVAAPAPATRPASRGPRSAAAPRPAGATVAPARAAPPTPDAAAAKRVTKAPKAQVIDERSPRVQVIDERESAIEVIE